MRFAMLEHYLIDLSTAITGGHHSPLRAVEHFIRQWINNTHNPGTPKQLVLFQSNIREGFVYFTDYHDQWPFKHIKRLQYGSYIANNTLFLKPSVI